MKACRFVLVGVLASISLPALALDKVGSAVAQGVTATMVRRGFISTDPRVVQTLSAMGVRTGANVASIGSGASWARVMGRLSPYATVGVAVYQGVQWYFDNQGKVYLAAPGSTSADPVFSSGIVAGQPCWGQSNNSNDCWGSVEESMSFLFYTSKQQYPSASYGVPTITYTGTTAARAAYNYSIPELNLNNWSGTKDLTKRNATITCAAGQGYSSAPTGRACTGAQLGSGPYAGTPVQPMADVQTAYDALPAEAKVAQMAPELAAELANRIWQDASLQPEYQGVPFNRDKPVTAVDVAPLKTSQPSKYPITSDLVSPVPATDPIGPIAENPNQTDPPPGATPVDLGPDPGITPPTLEDPPTEIFKPISDLVQPVLAWQVPAHAGNCPTWQASPSIAGHVFAIDLSSHCTIAEQYRSMIYAAALAGWLLAAFFIVFSA